MNSDSEILEATLLEIEPVGLSPELFSRLETAMDAAAADQRAMDRAEDAPMADEEEVLVSLRDLEPVAMSEELFSRLDSAMENWPASVPVEEKVVAMPFRRRFLGQPGGGMGWRSAAAVAVLGVGLGVLVSTPKAFAPNEDAAQTDANEVSSEKTEQLFDTSENDLNEVEQGDRVAAAAAASVMEEPSPTLPFRSDKIIGRTSTPVPNYKIAPVSMAAAPAVPPNVQAHERGYFWTANGNLMRCLELQIEARQHYQNDHGDELLISQPQRKIVIEPVVAD